MFALGLDQSGSPQTAAAPELPAMFPVSNSLQAALTAAAGALPPNRSALSRVDLLLAIMQGKGSGANFVRYALTMTVGGDGSIYNPRRITELSDNLRARQGQTSGEPVGGTLKVGSTSIPISVSLREMLALSRQMAAAQPIETGDVVAADASAPNSILAPIFNGWGAEVASAVLPRWAATDYAKRQVDYEDGSNPVSFESSGIPAEAAQSAPVTPTPTPVSAGLPAATAQATAAPAKLANNNWLGAAKAQAAKTVVRPDLANNIVEALDQAPFVVLVTQAAYESDALVRDLAALIATDDGSVLRYGSVIAPDPRELDGAPYNTISNALAQARGGIAYLPNLNDYLTDNNVSGLVLKAVSSGDPKIIMSMSASDWKTEQAKPFYRRGRAVLPPSPKADEIKQIFLLQKADLEKQLSRDGFAVTIGEPAFTELGRLAAKYPVDPFAILTTAAVGIRMSESAALRKLQKVAFNADKTIDAIDIDLALQKVSGIVVAPEDPERYLRMEEELNKAIIDQAQAIHVISEAIITAMGGIKDPKRPTGAFIFMGPSGVGKSETARALANFLFNDPNGVLRFDMSEYMEKHEVARLVGAPPGYVGYEEGGELTEAVRRKPYSVVLFDEFEKAHPDIMNTMLQILEEGKLTDGKGQATDFSNTIVIFTGNVGAENYQLIGQTDNDSKPVTEERVKTAVREEIRRTFRPEFLNRIGDENTDAGESNIVVFNMLKPEDMRPIAEIELGKLNKLLAENGLTLTVSDDLKAQLAQEGYSALYGARPLVRLIKRKLGFPLAQKILRREFAAGDKITASLANGEIVFSK